MKDNKLINISKNKKLIFIFIAVFIFIIFCGMFYYQFDYMDKNKEMIKMVKKGYLLLSIFSFLPIALLLKWINNKKEYDVSKVFFVIAAVIGSMYLMLSPLFTGSDENIHYYRIYEIANGNLLTPMISENRMGSEMPSSILNISEKTAESINYIDNIKMAKILLEKDKTILYDNKYPSAAIYSPIQYLPQVIGMKLGIIFNLTPYFIGILGRIFGFITWLFITKKAIEIIPTKKIFLSVILLLPSSIAFATCLSGDVLTNSTIVLFVAYIYNIVYNKSKVDLKKMTVICILGAIIALCKIVYFPIVLLFLLIPSESFKDKKSKYLLFTMLCIVTFSISLTWIGISDKYMNYYTKTDAQKKWIFTYPLRYIFIIIRTFSTQFMRLISDFIGGNMLYQTQLHITSIVIIMFWYVLISSMSLEKNKIKLTNIQKLIVVGIIGAILVLIATALFVQCTAQNVGIGVETVIGIQGRYLIPVAILSLFIVDFKNKIGSKEEVLNLIIILQIPVFLNMIYTFII